MRLLLTALASLAIVATRSIHTGDSTILGAPVIIFR